MSAEKSTGDGKNAPEASDGIDPDEIGVAGGAVDGAAGQDDVVAGLELQSGLRGLARVIEQHVSRVKGLAKHGQHAPRQRQLIPDGLVGGHADDIGRDAEARNLRTVRPERELTTMAFAPMSMAMPQVACEMASSRFLILKL